MTEDTNVTPQADTEEDTAKQLLHMCKSHDSLLSSDIPHVHFNKEVAVTNGEVLVEALDALTGAPVRIRYTNVKTFARGAFGMVFVASLDNGRQVAIKKLLRDKRYKNRELLILRQLRHPNIVALLYFFYTLPNSEGKEATQALQSPCDCCKQDRSSTSFTEPKEMYLNLVQEYVPETLSRIIKHYNSLRQLIPIALIKIYSFQILRALAYIHSQEMCHRDIKPQNILVNPETGILKICDFGSTKVLVPGEPNVSYICSRYYRAPELIFGATHYTVSIDIWSAGCVIGELLLGRPLFPGDSGIDQLVEIIKVLGTPTLDDVKSMNPHYSKFAFPLIKGCPWEKLIHRRSNVMAFNLLRDLLVYCPSNRQSAAKCLPSPFFSDAIFASPEEASSSVYCLVNGRPLPPLIDNFSDEELTYLPVDFAAKIRSAISILRSEPPGPSSSNNSSLSTGNVAMMDRTHSLPGFNLLDISSCSIRNDYSGTVLDLSKK